MSKEMVISANPHETRVAIMEEGQLCEYYVERQKEFALVGSIYKGRVTRVLPGMQSAFVEIGLDSDAFLYVSDFLEGIEEFDPIVNTVVDKVEKMEEQGGRVFATDNPAAPAVEPTDVEPPQPGMIESGAGEHPQPAASSASAQVLKPTAPVPAPSHIPPSDTASPDRPRFEGRNRGGRGGRDFRGRGGRRGRFNRRDGKGGGRGGERTFGRELPSSKYASPRPFEERTSEQVPGEPYVPVILPGESFAKYREPPPSAAAAASPETAIQNEQNAAAIAPEAVAHAPAHAEENLATEAPAEFRPEPRPENRPESRPENRREEREPRRPRTPEQWPSFSGLEPLPGETLSKWQKREPVAEEPPQTAGSAQSTEEARHTSAEESQPQASSHREAEIHIEDRQPVAEPQHVVEELSDDEAAALAEHIAEAEIEEEAHEAHRREMAADEAAEVAHNLALQAPPAEAASESETDADHEEHDLASGMEISEGEESEAGIEEFGELAAHGEFEPEDTAEHLAAAGEEGNAVREPGQGEPAQEQQPSTARVRDDFRARMQNPARRGRERDRGRRHDRGRRPDQGRGHGHGHRPQARRPQLIADLLKQGQEIIVQIAKEPLGKKGARITSHVALPGRYLVYMPTLDHTGVSRKIASAEERSRLRHLVNDAKGTAGGGFIVRTAAATAPPDDVRTDVEFLTRTWSEIKTRSEQRKAPSLLHRDLNLVERILRDYMSSEFAAIWVDSEEEYTKVVDFMSRFQPELVNRVKLFTKETPVFEEFGIQQEIDKSLRPKVWLKSGGYIVINHTEALVAIDVNTGKFVGKGSNRLEDTIVRTNLEAVKEIVRQMRLRDLGGIIVIDFIDMEDRRNREKVMAALEDALRADRAPSKMLRFNEFGLIAITRKRTKQALERTLCQPCPYCTGSGMVKSIPTLCYEIQTEARKMAAEAGSASLTLRVHPEISKAFKTRESSLIEELENWTKKSVIVQADPTLHWEQYDIY